MTLRELEVLRLGARGISNREIARELVVGDATVKTHVARPRIFSSLTSVTARGAVVLAYESGLVEPEGDRCPPEALPRLYAHLTSA